MRKLILLSILVAAAMTLSGCSLATNQTKGPTPKIVPNATFIRSTDGGTSWESRIAVDEKKTIASVNVLSVVVHPIDPNIVYLGTETDGIFVTKNNGETWENVPFADSVYGLVIDRQNPNIMYGSGVVNKRAKIYKREAEDQEWKEIYTEPAEGTMISSLAVDPNNGHVLYAGTNEGVIIKSVNAGATWQNMTKAEGPVTNIVMDARNTSQVYFGVFQFGILRSRNAGGQVDDITKNIDKLNVRSSIFTIVTDPFRSGLIYAGTDKGIMRSFNNGDDWESLNIIESSKAFPIRAIAINPVDSREIIYSSAKALYISKDAGAKWATFHLDTGKSIGMIKYNAFNPQIIYAGLRSFD